MPTTTRAKARAPRVNVAAEFMEAMREAAAIATGEAQPARVTVPLDPKAIPRKVIEEP